MVDLVAKQSQQNRNAADLNAARGGSERRTRRI